MRIFPERSRDWIESTAPGATYVNPGFTIEFYLRAVVLTFLAAAFGLGGWVEIRIYRWMVNNGLDLP